MDRDLNANDWIRLLLASAREPFEAVASVCRQRAKQFQPDVARALADAVRRILRDGQSSADEVTARLAGLQSATADYVLAQLSLDRQDAPAACQFLQRAQDRLPGAQPDLLLEIARLQRTDDPAGAIASVQLALRTCPDYGWYSKAQPVIDKLMKTAAWKPRRTLRLALLASSTTSLLAPVLRCAGFARGMQFDIHEAAFGNYEQEILDPASPLYAARPDLAVLLLNSRDADFGPVDEQDRAGQLAERLRELWGILRQQTGCHLIQVGLDTPASGPWGCLEDSLPLGRHRQVRKANLRLSQDLPEGVSFLDADSLSRLHAGTWRSDADWHTSRQYPSLAALPVLASAIAATGAAVAGLSAKVLALDLDNTLWGGVVGEDGVSGIRIGPPDAAGESYAALQRYIRELKQRGILLTVCSKNNQADAEEPFRRHDGMVLRLEDFVAFTANWQDKAQNLAQQAEDLQLGLDSFVLLDDSALERAWVRGQTEAVVPEAGDNAIDMLAALRRGMYFEAVRLTAEDMQRFGSYQSIAEQKKVARSGADMAGFLRGLQMCCTHGPVDEVVLPRIEQLIQKTNQFNLTTRRYSAAQLQEMACSPEWWCRWFRLDDRFGDHGLVGVMLAKREPECWQIDTWLMSCRVLGRQMEQFMIGTLLRAARAAGALRVTGTYVPTAKNGLVQDLYPRMCFESTGRAGEYALDLGQRAVPACDFISEMTR